MAPVDPPLVRFGIFQLDRRSAELTRAGRRVHLPAQAARLLVLLTDRAGEVVARDEIRAALWPGDTFVEFNTAINACISQVRAALGDRTTTARFIETLPRRGYRFIAPVEMVQESGDGQRAATAAHTAAALPTEQPPPAPERRVSLALAAIAVFGLGGLIAFNALHTRRSFAEKYSVEAIRLYECGVSGLADAAPTDLQQRVKNFEAAIARESSFAEAYTGMADAKLILGGYRAEPPAVAYAAAKAAAAKAVALGPRLGEAHAMYAAAVLHYEWDWVTSATHFQRALALAPSSPRVHQWYSRYATALGRHAEAEQHAARAVRLAPTSPSALTHLGIAEFYAGHREASRQHCQRALDLMPEFVPASQCLEPTPEGVFAAPARWAAAGETDKVLDWLQRAANRRSDVLLFAAVQPAFVALRDHPRFENVLARVGLPAASERPR